MPAVFVSHATRDDARVTELHDALEAATKTDLWVDHKDIPAGAPWETTIERALKDCPHCLVVLSRQSVLSEEVRAEWRAAITYGHAVLPVIFDDVPFEDIPPRLRSFQFVRLRTADEWDAGIRALADAILGRTAPGTDGDAPRFKRWPITGDLPRELVSIPMQGRDDDLHRVLRLLNEAPTSIVGVGGLGKSRLAAEVVLTSPEAYGAIWHRCTDASIPGEVFVLLREHFALPPEAPESEVLRRLKTQRRVVVIDNAESVLSSDPRRAAYVTLIERLAANGAHVLLTSRTEWPQLRAPRREHEPRALDLTSALRATLEIARAYNDLTLSEELARQLAEAANFHPGMIKWAIEQLAAKRRPEQVLGWLTTANRERLDEPLDALVLTTLKDMRAEEAEGAAAEALLRRLCVFAGPFERAAALAVGKPHPHARLSRSQPSPRGEGEESLTPKSPLRGERGLEEEDFDDALVLLRRWRFVREDADGRYAVPPIVRTALEADDDARAAHFAHYYGLHGDYDANTMSEERHPLITRDFEELRAALNWGEARQARQTADLAHALNHYMQLHQPYPIWRAVLEGGQQAALRADYARGQANTLQALGDLDLREADYPAARARYTHALALFEAIPDRLGQANTLKALGDLDRMETDYPAARARYTHALALFEAIPARLGQANTLKALGDLDRMEDDYPAARARYSQALALVEAIPDRLGQANTLRGMGNLLQAQEDWGAAVSHFEQAIVIFQAIGDQYSYGIVCTDMQPALLALGRHEDALRRALDALAIDTEIGVQRNIDIDRRKIQELKTQIGDEAFAAAWRAVTGTDDLPEWLGNLTPYAR
ncbi:MAG: TIR domain-containing protein [Anaerolineae bacterium]|nr:TIR domain-containing protein [Anaerolineae bacterium]